MAQAAQAAPPVRQAELRSLSCLDAVYAASNQPAVNAAIEICQQAVSLTQAAGDQRLEAYSRGNLGSLYLQEQAQQQAIAQFEQVLSIAQQQADPALEVKALVALGTAYAQQPQTALSHYQQAFSTAEAASDLNGMAIALYNSGLMHDALGDYQQAIAAYQQAEKTATASGDVILASYATQKLALAHQAVIQVGATP